MVHTNNSTYSIGVSCPGSSRRPDAETDTNNPEPDPDITDTPVRHQTPTHADLQRAQTTTKGRRDAAGRTIKLHSHCAQLQARCPRARSFRSQPRSTASRRKVNSDRQGRPENSRTQFNPPRTSCGAWARRPRTGTHLLARMTCKMARPTLTTGPSLPARRIRVRRELPRRRRTSGQSRCRNFDRTRRRPAAPRRWRRPGDHRGTSPPSPADDFAR